MAGQGRTPNETMVAAWDGPEGDNWVENEAFFNQGVRLLNPVLFDAAAIVRPL